MKKILALSIFMRLLFMPFFAFPHDLFDVFFSSLKVLEQPTYIFTIAYSPLSQLISTILLVPFRIFLPQIPVNFIPTYPFFLPQLNRILFILKLPFLIAEYCAYFVLMKLFTQLKLKETIQRNIVLFLLFNPITVYGIYIFGRFESYNLLISFILLLFIYRHKRLTTWHESLQLAGILNIALFTREFYFPLIFIVLLLRGNLWKKILICTASITPYLLYILINASRSEILSTYGGGQISKVYFLFFIPIGLISLLYSWKTIDWKKADNFFIFSWFSSIFLVAYYASSVAHPQYYIWVIPFLIGLLLSIKDLSLIRKILRMYWIISFLFLFILLKEQATTFGVAFPIAQTFRSIDFISVGFLNYKFVSAVGKFVFIGVLYYVFFHYVQIFSRSKAKIRS